MGGGRPRAGDYGRASPNRSLNRQHEVGSSPVTPAPSLRHSCAGRNHHHHPTSPFPNSSLPPLRGEVRWGVGGHEPATTAVPAPIAHSTVSTRSAPLPSLLPLPSVIPAQAGTTTTTQLPPSPIHPSPLSGEVRWGWEATSRRLRPCQPQPPTQPPTRGRRLSRHSCPFTPSFLRRQEPRRSPPSVCASTSRPSRFRAATERWMLIAVAPTA